MIRNIIFDFGDVFINLDKEAVTQGFKNLGLTEWNEDLQALNFAFEKGKMKDNEFLMGIQKHIPNQSLEKIKEVWNLVLKDFPLYRLEFLEKLKESYNLFLLSNTDSIHIQRFREKEGEEFYKRFEACFTKIYYSFDINKRKPDLGHL